MSVFGPRYEVPAGVSLKVHYSPCLVAGTTDKRLIILHHGICHTREQFDALITELNALGLSAVMIEQQSKDAGLFRNFIGLSQYRSGMAAAIRAIQAAFPDFEIAGYVCHSMGALICEETQKKFRELRRPMVFMTPIPINGALPTSLRIFRRYPLAYLKAVVTMSVLSLLDTVEECRDWFFDDHTPQAIVNTTTPQLTHSPFWSYLQLVLRPIIRPRIDDDGRPKLLFLSDTDDIFHLWEYDNIRTRYPNIDETHIPGGHDFFIEYAKETANEIAEFFATPAPAPPAPHFLQKRMTLKSIPPHP